MPNANSEICAHCHLDVIGDLTHSLLLCPYNDGAGQYLIAKVLNHIPNLVHQQVTLLDLDLHADHQLPLVFLVAAVLSDVWESRKDKKPCHLHSIRAALEAVINIMRKSKEASETLMILLVNNYKLMFNKDMKQKLIQMFIK